MAAEWYELLQRARNAYTTAPSVDFDGGVRLALWCWGPAVLRGAASGVRKGEVPLSGWVLGLPPW